LKISPRPRSRTSTAGVSRTLCGGEKSSAAFLYHKLSTPYATAPGLMSGATSGRLAGKSGGAVREVEWGQMRPMCSAAWHSRCSACPRRMCGFERVGTAIDAWCAQRKSGRSPPSRDKSFPPYVLTFARADGFDPREGGGKPSFRIAHDGFSRSLTHLRPRPRRAALGPCHSKGCGSLASACRSCRHALRDSRSSSSCRARPE